MLNNNFQNILIKFGLWLGTGILIAIVGISNVFADTTYDMKDFVKLTGRRWSVTGNETSSNITYDHDWVKNNYNFTGGIYTPPNTYDRINYSFFEKNNGVFNPCTNDDFTATFKIKFSNPSLMTYISSISWSGVACSQVQNVTTGIIDVVCTRSPLTGNYNDIFVNYRDYTGTDTTDIYISRYMTISCGLNTGAIINNNNQNTQNIINNNNNNTQEIINNQNENTDKEIESQKVCNLINKDNILLQNKFLDTNGNENSSNGWGITDYINISNSTIEFTDYSSNTSTSTCFYTESKSLISCSKNNNLTIFQIPNNAIYMRMTILVNNNLPRAKICKNGNQALNDSINGLNDNLNDDDSSGATGEASDFFEDFTTNTFGLTSIITAPLNLIQSLTSSTCTDLRLPLPYLNNKYIILPCMTPIYQQHFGSFLTIYQTITYGIIAYWVIVRIFNQVKDFKNPEHDEIEVVDL